MSNCHHATIIWRLKKLDANHLRDEWRCRDCDAELILAEEGIDAWMRLCERMKAELATANDLLRRALNNMDDEVDASKWIHKPELRAAISAHLNPKPGDDWTDQSKDGM